MPTPETEASPPVVMPTTVQPAGQAYYVREGESIDYTPSTTAANAGDVIVQGGLVGVATHPILVGQAGSLQIQGTFDFTKKANDIYLVGSAVYWDASNNWTTSVSAAMAYLGKCVKAAASTDARARVKLLQLVP
jgi:predicted RecA/RadA family phage recombinase